MASQKLSMKLPDAIPNTHVDVDEDAGFVTGVNAWDRDRRARCAGPPARDLNLPACNLWHSVSHGLLYAKGKQKTHVELRTTECRGDVQRDSLHTDEVLSARKRSGDREVDTRHVLGGERD